MPENKRRLKTLALLLTLFLLPCFLHSQTPPEDFLGHKVGADRKLADYGQIQAYFKKLDQESERIKVINIGTTTLKKPMIMAIITVGIFLLFAPNPDSEAFNFYNALRDGYRRVVVFVSIPLL